MADEQMLGTEPPLPTDPVQPPSSSGGGLKTFFSSATGRIVLAVIGVVVLAAIAGAVAFVFFGLGGTSGNVVVVPSTVSPNQGGSGGAQGAGDPSAAPTEAPEPVAISDVFTFRDIFEPTVKPTTVATESAGTTESTSGTSGSTSGSGESGSGETASHGKAGDGTLFLEDIVSEDGKQVAVLTFDGTEYRLTAGERVDDSPWKVLEVNTNSVVMLFGDTQVTLSVGQGMTK